MSISSSPRARVDGLITTETGSDLLIYDTERHELHTLNPVAASVWRAADGTRSVFDLAVELELEPDAIDDALGRLATANLMEHAPTPSVTSGRRRFLKGAAVAGAVVVSVSAPVAASNGSTNCGRVCPSGLNSECSHGIGSCGQCRDFQGTFLCCNPGGGGTFQCP